MSTRDENAQLRRLRQVTNANQFKCEMQKEMQFDIKTATSRISALAQCEQATPTFSEKAEFALLGIESGDTVAAIAEPVVTATLDLDSSSRTLTRQLSKPSMEAMEQLDRNEVLLAAIEGRVAELDRLAQGQDCPNAEGLGHMKTELAQLEADGNKLENKGVDSIYTSNLVSGQDQAKQRKKEQLRRLESLFALIDQLFRFFKTKA